MATPFRTTERRSLIACLLAAVMALACFGASAPSAGAEERVFTVTLTDGNTMPLTLDVVPGTPLQQIQLPAEIADFIYSVSDGTTTVLAKDLARAPAAPTEEADEPEDENPGVGGGIKQDKPKAQHEGSAGTGEAITAEPSGKDDSGSKNAGAPDPSNPTYSYALPGPAPIGVPNFFIDRFRIPPFLLPIYQAAGIEYGVRWEVLAAINEIETDYGRNLNVSSAGALGWMQFMPSTWEQYGVDANDDGKKDPYNPVDAIFAAARYLRAAGAEKDLEKAIFAYNHADWYVDSVLLRAKVIAGMPTDLVGSLTGLTQGRFPVDAEATYAGAITTVKEVEKGENAARAVTSDSKRKSVRIFAETGSKVIAVHDGELTKIGQNYIQLRDVFGNSYTYGRLKEIAQTHQVRVEEKVSEADIEEELAEPKNDPAPDTAASKSDGPATKAAAASADDRRIYANPNLPDEPDAGDNADDAPVDVKTETLRVGSNVTAGTVLGTIGKTTELGPHTEFSIRPAGRGAPKIDPKPILDGWKLLETTAIYRAADKNPFYGPDAAQPTIGQILLMSKETLSKRVLADPRIEIYECGQRDIEAGIVDRRVLATLSFLAVSGFEPTVTSLRCGHSRLTTSGRVSNHSHGGGVDIAKINGTPILGHQGPGSITDQTVRKLLTLQGTMRPDEIITLAEYEGADNTFAMSDHADHIHVGFKPLGDRKLAKTLNATLKASQWDRLMERLNQIENPTVKVKPSEFAITDTASPEKSGEHSD